MPKTSGQGVAHIPTEENKKLVRMLSAVGTRYEDIATKLDITDDTLRKHYRKELDEGRIEANASVAQTLYQQAKNGNTTAAIFWLKTRAQWRETNTVEHTGLNGGPIEVSEIAIKLVRPDAS